MATKSANINFYKLGFNFIETKAMFVSDYRDGKWDEGRLVPFGPIELSPAACVLNYGQGIFEGMKAIRTKIGDIVLFRPIENALRLNMSADRLLMPQYNAMQFVENIKQVVKANEEYIPPYDSGGSLYIRPLMIGSGPLLGIAPATEYMLIIFVSPVGPYFHGGFMTIDMEISKKYVRAAPGGTGCVKTCSNYASTMKPMKETKAKGFSQVIYLDSVKKEYIEEAGAANIFAVIDGKLATPKLTGTILPGIIRKSVLELAKKKLGMEIEEREISYRELYEPNCTEAFCTGTAAVITPIGSVTMEGTIKEFNNKAPGPITTELYKLLIGIQYLEIEDDFGWVVKVE